MIGTLLTRPRGLATIFIVCLLCNTAGAEKGLPSPPRFCEAFVSGNQFNFALTGPTGRVYTIECKADLAATQWITLTNVTTTNEVTRFADRLQTNSSRMYFGVQHYWIIQNQIYPVNSVGYCNRTFSAGTNLFANPLFHTNNTLNTILPVAPHGATVRKPGPGGWYVSVYSAGQGWLDGGTLQPSTMCLNPGEGAVLTSPSAFNHTFVGEVPLSWSVNIPVGWSLRSSAFKSGRITTDLGFPAQDNDLIARFDPTQQIFPDEYFYTYLEGTWYSITDVEPTVSVGEAFWIETSSSKVWQLGGSIPFIAAAAGFGCSDGTLAPTCAAAGVDFNLTGDQSPGILVQPQSQTVPSGTNVTFAVDACGTPPLRYQWYFDGAVVGGATNFSLARSNVQIPNIGDYKVAISNAFGAVTSAVASLIVIPTEPIVIQNLQVAPNGTFIFRFNAQPGLDYQVEYTTDLVSWSLLLSIAASSGGTVSVADVSPLNSTRFYRVREQGTGRYSANVVGYANISISSQWQVIANPLRFSALNEVPDVLPLVPDLTELLKVGAAGLECSVYSEFDAAWFDCSSSPAATLSPGEGAILRSDVSSAITFIGEVFEGFLTNKLPAGLSLCGSIVPQAGAISSMLGFPAEAGDVIYKFNPTNDTYAAHTYLGNGSWDPSEPAISVAEGFWAQLGSPREWIREFSTGGSALRAYTITNRPYIGPTGGIVPQPPPRLVISHSGSQVTVSWNAPEFFLQQAGLLSGPWGDVTGTSPYTMPIIGNRFFRLRHQTAAVYSANVVGYISVAMSAGKKLINNPFLASPDNSLESVLPVVPDLTVLYKVGASEFDADLYEEGFWFNNTLTLSPGEGAILDASTPFTATFVGEIVQGALTNKLPAGLSLCSVPVPVSAPITSQLSFPAENGDVLYRLNPSTQTYDAYNYVAGSWQPQEPVPNIGEAFWVELGSARTWVTQFFATGTTPGYCVTNPPYNGPRDPMLTPRVPPTIYAQPEGQTNEVGTVATFTVGASGSPALRYQWRRNGVPLAGATNATLTISNVQPAHAGGYSVVVTNAYGSTNSTVASLTVLQTPVLHIELETPTEVTVSWSASATGFILQSAAVLCQLTSWSNVPNSPVVIGGTNYVTFSNSGGSQFFRLSNFGSRYSQNIVGYVNRALSALNNVIANPLHTPANHLSELFPTVENETMICKVGTTNFESAIFFDGTWYDFNSGFPSEMTLSAGEGAILQTPQAFTVTFVGDALQGPLTNYIPTGLSLCSSIAPCTAALTPSEGFPLEAGDTIYQFNPFIQVYDALTYLGNNNWQPYAPVVSPAEGFWVERANSGSWATLFFDPAGGGPYSITNRPFVGPRDPVRTPRVPPTIAVQPQCRTNQIGGTATFNVIASGSPVLRYQWRFNNASIPGATNAMLTISNAQPAQAGDYTVVVTNSFGSVTSAPACLHITAPCAIASTARSTYAMRTRIPIEVRSIDCTSSNNFPNQAATVYIRTAGTTRTLAATTDSGGVATVNFDPLAGEAGHYEIAAAPSGQTNPPTLGSFDIIGMSLDTSGMAGSITAGAAVTNHLPVRNLTDRELTGITATLVGTPPQLLLQAMMTGPLPAEGTNVLVCVLRGFSSTAPSNYILRATSAEGATNDAGFNLGIAPTTSRLVFAPAFLAASMLRGTQTLVTVYVTNTGGAPANNLRVLLPDPTPPWMGLVSPAIFSLPPRGSAAITLSLTPSNTLPLEPYFGNLILRNLTGDTSIDYQFDCVEALASTLRVQVEDEFTYLAEGAPRVGNAQVKLLDAQLKTVIATMNTDPNGIALFTGLAEGYYEVDVSADGHESFNRLVEVTTIQTNEVSVFLARNFVSYRWIVTTQEISDRYIFTLDARFQTDVPAPVVRVEPGALDLCQYPLQSNVVNLTIYNSGLIAARDARLTFGAHPNYVIRPVTVTGQIGDIPARSNVVVPVLILRVPGATNPVPSFVDAQLDWELPLPGTQARQYRLPIPVYNAGAGDCEPGSPGSTPIWGGSFGFGGPASSGGSGGGPGGGPGGSVVGGPGGTHTAEPPIFVTERPDIVTVEVGIQLSQTAIMTRRAFEASLELINESTNALSNVAVLLEIRDTNGVSANHLFGIRPPEIRNLGAVDGTGSLAAQSSGDVKWIIIPATNAAPTAPTRYTVGGRIRFRDDGGTNEIVLFDVPVVVLPDARLLVDYFLEQLVFSDDPNTLEVEPPIPFHVGLHMRNVGLGTAFNVQVNSTHLQIVDNASGLLLHFQLLGTQVNTQSLPPTLAVSLGDILPGSNGVATWSLAASLQGRFVNYNASFIHLDDLGKMNLSIVDSIRPHPMVHLVRADVPGDDGIPDYLVNDSISPTLLADRLYLSEGRSETVTSVTNAVHNGPPGPGQTNLQLTFTTPPGWVYLRITNPGDGTTFLTSVRRSDGRMLLLGTNVWTTRRIVYPPVGDPYLEDFLHLFDRDSTGLYTLGYGLVPVRPAIVSQPTSQTNIAGSTVTFTVNASGTEPLAYQWYHNGMAVPGSIFSVLNITNVATNQAGVYFVTVANEAGSTNSASATLTVLAPPTIDPVADRFVVVGEQLVITNRAYDPDLPIIFSLGAGPFGATITPDGIFRWTPTCAQGSTVNQVRIWARDTGSIPLSNSVPFTITVLECIEAGLGQTNVYVGQTSSVPVLLISTVALTNMAFTVIYPPERFSTNFALEVNSPQVLTQSVRLLEPGRVKLSFTLSSNAVLHGPTNVAQFRFTALPDQSSAFVPLPIADIDARKPNGEIVANAFGAAGRVIVIGVEPLLEARRGFTHPLLTVYANTGISYTLQTALELSPGGPWSNAFPIILTNSFKSFDWTNQGERSRFFRVTLP